MATETARTEAFSDGVFAIAITLLILEIRVPDPNATGSLWLQLARQWPSYLAFLISFLSIGIMWINHHRIFTHVRRCDNSLLVLNLLLLLGVSFVPFPTAVVAKHIGYPGERAAVIFYNATYLAIAIVFNLMWRYCNAHEHHLLGNDFNRDEVRNITEQYAYGPSVYVVCIILAWFSTRLSLGINLAAAIFFLIPPAQSARLKHHGRAEI